MTQRARPAPPGSAVSPARLALGERAKRAGAKPREPEGRAMAPVCGAVVRLKFFCSKATASFLFACIY